MKYKHGLSNLVLPSDWPRVADHEGPKVYIDGVLFPLDSLNKVICGEIGVIFGAKPKNIDRFRKFVRVEDLRFRDMRIDDLSELEGFETFQHLYIWWNTKLTSLESIKKFPNLKSLVLHNTKKVTDLEPISALSKLESFEFSDGVWGKSAVESYSPLLDMPNLTELWLDCKPMDGDFRSLARMKNLDFLNMPAGVPAADLIYLSIKLPKTECSQFKPFQSSFYIDREILHTNDKPSRSYWRDTDSEKIAAFEKKWQALKEKAIRENW